MRAVMLAWALVLVSACGGAGVSEPDEDVSVVWTAGDDAPLEDAPD